MRKITWRERKVAQDWVFNFCTVAEAQKKLKTSSPSATYVLLARALKDMAHRK